MFKRAILTIVLLLVTALPAAAQATDTDRSDWWVTNVHEYAWCDNGAHGDDTQGVQMAINKWLAVGGTLQFGDDQCLITDTLRFYRPDNSPVFGIVRGMGPEVTTIKSAPGFPAAEFRNFKYGEISGIKFSGGPAKTDSLDHAGLILGNGSAGLGSNGIFLHNLTFEHFGVGLELGNYRTAGSAAEITADSIGISQTHIGVFAVTFNTLDVRFTNLNLSEDDAGVYTDTAYGMSFSGAGTNNGTTFVFKSCCEEAIGPWREELSRNSGRFIEFGGPTETRLTLQSVSVIDTLGRQQADIIHGIPGANSAITVIGSFLNGNVSANKYVSIQGSALAAPAPYVGTPTHVFISGVCKAALNDGQCVADFPNEFR